MIKGHAINGHRPTKVLFYLDRLRDFGAHDSSLLGWDAQHYRRRAARATFFKITFGSCSPQIRYVPFAHAFSHPPNDTSWVKTTHPFTAAMHYESCKSGVGRADKED
jgi:hypothetical protein